MVGSRNVLDETYDLRGLNLVLPDMVKPNGESPYAINFRMYARDEEDTRVAIRTRKGSEHLTVAIGETLDAQNVDTSTGDLAFSSTRILAQPFTAGASGALSRLDFELKKGVGATGHVIVEFRANNGGIPGTLLGSTSILSSDITDAYQYLTSYLMDNPSVVNGTQYWALLYVQDNGTGEYYVRQTADSGALDLESSNEQMTWSSIGASFRFKSYLATSSGVKGYVRIYPSNGNKRTIFAAGNSVYSVADNGTVTVISTAINVSSTFVRFEFFNDLLYWVDGFGTPKQYNPASGSVDSVTGAPLGATHLRVHAGRMFFIRDKTLASFSDLYDPNSYPSVNFFYVPSPKSSDPVTGWRVFQDNLLIFTYETKHTIYGSDISSFTRKEAISTKGAVSDEAIACDKNYCFFMADDGSIQAWNGTTDIDCSTEKMEPEFASISDKSKVRFHLYRNQLRIYYPSSTSSFNNRMAILDLANSNFATRDFRWYKDTGRNIAGSLEWNQDNDNPLIEFSSRTGTMYRGERTGSDVGKPIDFKYWTAYKTYGSGSAKKRVKRFRPVIRTGDADFTLSVGKDMDFANDPDMRAYVVTGGGAKWGQFIWGDGTLFGRRSMIDKPSAMSGRGNHIQYRFEREGVETPVELYGYIAQVKVGKPR